MLGARAGILPQFGSEENYGLPACDTLRHGPAKLVKAVIKPKKSQENVAHHTNTIHRKGAKYAKIFLKVFFAFFASLR
jgi:hypothetical protein